MHLFSAMSDKAFWHSDPEALLANAAQALEAKRAIGRLVGRDWTYVDTYLGAVLLEIVRLIPEKALRRRREDRRLVAWVSRLIPEIPADDPYRPQVLRRLKQIL
jgi:hypothetical protein